MSATQENNSQYSTRPSSKRILDDDQPTGSKRSRPSPDQNDDRDEFHSLLHQAGFDLNALARGSYEVEDSRQMCRVLEQKLTLNNNLTREFMDGLENHLEPLEVLHAALKPMEILDPDATIMGDSFIHSLLSVTVIQQQLTEMLLIRLCEFCDDDDSSQRRGNDPNNNNKESSIPQLILGQFRWLHAPLDARHLTQKLLEVLPAMPVAAQYDALALLEEVAEDDDFETVVEAITKLIDDECSFLVPAFKALSNMAQDEKQRGEVVELVIARFQSAAPEDLPAVIGFLIQAAAVPGGVGAKALATLRAGLHFLNPSDPRLALPDIKGKRRVGSCDDHPELQVLEAMKQALQLSATAVDVLLKTIDKVNVPEDHKTFDLWALLVVSGLGPERAKTAEGCVVKKLREGHAEEKWLTAGVQGHEVALKPMFTNLLSLAQRLVRAPQELPAAGGSILYRKLFLCFPDAYSRQETLRTWHSHLGSATPQEVTTALHILRDMAVDDPTGLMSHATFVTAVLDHVDRFGPPQAAAAFEAFAELVGGTCERRDAHGEAGGSGGEGARSRFEDELFVFLRKQLSGADVVHRRVGVTGTVALVKRLGCGEGSVEDTNTDIGKKYEEAISLLNSALGGHVRSPETFAMLCDEMSRVVATGSLPRRLAMDLSSRLKDLLETKFLLDDFSALDTRCGIPSESLWDLNADPSMATVCGDLAIELLPVVVRDKTAAAQRHNNNNEVNGGVGNGNRGLDEAHIAAMLSLMRLVCLLERQVSGPEMTGLDALVGCAMCLCTQDTLKPEVFARLDAASKNSVLLGLFYAANWCRELANAFGPALSVTADGCLQPRVLSRLRAACQFEAVLRKLLVAAPPGFALPALGATAGTAAGAKVVVVKPAGKGRGSGNGGGGKKKTKAAAGTENVGGEGGDSGSGEHEASKSMTTNNNNDGSGGAGGSSSSAAGVAVDKTLFRTLLPSAFACLTLGTSSDDSCYSALAPAAYLLEDINMQLKAALAAKKPAGPFNRQPKTTTTVTLPELLATLKPLFPAIRRHMDVALNVADLEMDDKQLEKQERQTIWAALLPANVTSQMQGGTGGGDNNSSSSDRIKSYLAVLKDSDAAEFAVSATENADKVILLVLECLRMLLTFSEIVEPDNRPVVQALLSAFNINNSSSSSGSGDSAGGDGSSSDDEVWSVQKLTNGIKQAFRYLNQHLPSNTGTTKSTKTATTATAHDGGDEEEEEEPLTAPGGMEAWLAILKVEDALLSLDQRLLQQAQQANAPTTEGLKRRTKMQSCITDSAVTMLKQKWNGGAWKASSVAEVLKLHLDNQSEKANEAIQDILDDPLTTKPTAAKSTKSTIDATEFPSYTSNTLPTWYDAAWKTVASRWKGVVESADGLAKNKDLVVDSEAVEIIINEAKIWATQFTQLIQLVKMHDVPKIHALALSNALPVLEGFRKTDKFWSVVFSEHGSSYVELCKVLQKGVAILQTACNEGKARADDKLAALVPKVKKACERFICGFAAQIKAQGLGSMVQVGERNHRDLQNRIVPSQLHPELDEDDDDEEEDEDVIEEAEEGQQQEEDDDMEKGEEEEEEGIEED